MNKNQRWKPLLISLVVTVVVFLAISVLDIVLSVLYARFYSTAAFIVTFGVGGVFAGLMGYTYGMEAAKTKDELANRSLIIFLVFLGILYFFPLAFLEGGEYSHAFKAFGVMVALSPLLFLKDKGK